MDDSNSPTSRPSRRKFLQSVLGASPALAIAATGKPAQRGNRFRWQIHPVADIPGGYQVAVADVNADGRPDILALSAQQNIVDWYPNPSWRARNITTATQKNICLAPLFLPGYPARGMALASGFYLNQSDQGGNVWWTEPGPSLDGEWSVTLIGRIPASHRLRWADFDGDGRLELLDVPIVGGGSRPPDYSIPSPITWFQMPQSLLTGHAEGIEEESDSWTSHLIDRSLTLVHGVLVMDWDADGRDEFLTASTQGVTLFKSQGRGTSVRWTKRLLTPGDQTSRYHGSSEIGLGKIHGRRFLATIEPWHGENVVVYTEAGESGFRRRIIDSSFRSGHALACADLDDDGNDEIVAGYRGPGTSLFVYHIADRFGTAWERETLDTNMAASGVVIADLNQDSRLDVVAVGSSTANVRWYENLGS